MVRQSWTAHDRQQRLAIAFRQTLRDHANGPISPGDVLHRISETILLLCARDYHLPPVIAAAQTFSCLHPSPPFGSLAPQRPVTMPIAGGTAVPGGLVQHVFSPLARIKSLATDLSWQRHCAKNALHYAESRIMPSCLWIAVAAGALSPALLGIILTPPKASPSPLGGLHMNNSAGCSRSEQRTPKEQPVTPIRIMPSNGIGARAPLP